MILFQQSFTAYLPLLTAASNILTTENMLDMSSAVLPTSHPYPKIIHIKKIKIEQN